MSAPTDKTPGKDFIFASYLTGVYDVNRNESLQDNDFSVIQKWYESVKKLKLNAVIFHNSFSKSLIEQYTNEQIQFVEVDYQQQLKPNVYRYFVYLHYLQQCTQTIDHLFVTDISDVEVLMNPFETEFFKAHPDHIFCGDEPVIFDNEWMRNHGSHLRNLLPEYSAYEEANRHQTLLNCGIIGGSVATMTKLFEQMVALHERVSYTNTSPYTLDMGVFNFILRQQFKQQIQHGEPINTVFKKYESQRTDCWFRHK